MASEKDEEFRTLFEPHRRAIVAHCYRMLGSLAEAEELAQESLLRAWQKRDDRTSEGATRAWLYQVATRACLDVLRKDRRRRSLPHLVAATTGRASSAHEPLWVEPAPDSLFELDAAAAPDARVALKESVGLAFVTALQLLSPKQRAALLLVDVLGWKPEETAQRLETTTASVHSLLQRARKNVEVGAPTSRETSAPESTALLRRYIAAWESGDLDVFAALLADDARLSMPPQPEHYVGRETIRRFLEGILRTQPARYRLVELSANGAPAVAIYASVGAGPYQAAAISVLSIRGDEIAAITRFGMPGLFPRFGMPVSLPSDAAR